MGESKFKIQRELIKLHLLRKQIGPDYYRSIEYPITIQALDLNPTDVVADIGSLESFLPLYVAKRCKKVFAIDLSPSVSSIEQNAMKLGIDNVESVIENATRLSFTDGYFDKITAMGSIEHFLPLESGDIDAIKEIDRLLKPGGIAVITVPYGQKFENEWRTGAKKTFEFLQRRYDEKSLYERLIKPIEKNASKIEMSFFGSRMGFHRIWFKKLGKPLYPFSFIACNIFLRHTVNPKNSEGAVIVFKKNKI